MELIGLRRIFASNLVLNHVDPKVTQISIGHADISTTYKYYVEVGDDEVNEELSQVDDVVLAQFKNKKMAKVS